jgi:excisionase family DNA binding protein
MHFASPSPIEPLCASIDQTAAALGCSRPYVYELIKTGKLEIRKLGRSTKVTVASIRAYFNSLPTGPDALSRTSHKAAESVGDSL